MAMAPTGQDGLPLVVASWRAGGIGILDGLRAGLAAARMRELDRFGVGTYAVRLRADQIEGESFASVRHLPGLIICTDCRSPGVLERACESVHDARGTLICEVTSVEQAEAALAAGADGLVAVGNEAGGWVGGETTFVLLQALLARTDRPVWARGGIGPRSAAGCIAAGAAGVILDGAVLLARESGLPEEVRRRLQAWDGSEPVLIDSADGSAVRVYAPRKSPVLERLAEAARIGGETFVAAVEKEVGWGPGQAWPAGQDAALAADLAARHVTVGGIVQAVSRAIDAGLAAAVAQRPLAEGSPLAQAPPLPVPDPPGTDDPGQRRRPVRRGRRAGGRSAVRRPGTAPAAPGRSELLEETARRLEGRPWGVGLLGFAPPELRQEQLAAVRAARPPFALIAGGRPDQAAELEAEGIATYLHVPSPGLLDQYLRAGARRFVLEGASAAGTSGRVPASSSGSRPAASWSRRSTRASPPSR